MSELPCPSCGSELAYLEQYHRHYCYHCQRYAPEGYGGRGAQRCPTCGGILSYVTQYDRFYCYHCNAYPAVLPPEAEPQEAEATKPAAEPAAVAPVVPAIAEVPPFAAETKREEPSPEPEPVTAADAAAPEPKATPSTAEPNAVAAAPAESELRPATAEAAPAAPVEPEKPVGSPYASMKPAALRVKLFSLKKAELVDLSKVYGLDVTGTKEDLQQRLLAHLRDLESRQTDAQWIPKPAEASAAPSLLPASPAAETPKTETIAVPAPAPTTKPVEVVQARIPEPEPKPEAPAAVLVEPQPVARVEPTPAPVVLVAPEPVAATAAVEEAAQPHVEHPCPTCGRELAYITQYARWYCYFCQRYTPAEKVTPRYACPTCGATLRWIHQYERWWCDRCSKYASADLPRPKAAATGVATAAPTAASASEASVATPHRAAEGHRHGSPVTGVGLILLGVILFVVYQAFAVLPGVFNFTSPLLLTPNDAAILDFLAFILVAAGAVVGLVGMRHR